jgi:hypothetical protein
MLPALSASRLNNCHSGIGTAAIPPPGRKRPLSRLFYHSFFFFTTCSFLRAMKKGACNGTQDCAEKTIDTFSLPMV